MADANWQKKAPPVVADQDDPFAELTRIMGFDPRVPFAKQDGSGQQQAAAPANDPADDDFDMSIDLEQELMGALAEPVAARPAIPAAPRVAAAAQPRAAAPRPLVVTSPFHFGRATPVAAPAQPTLDEQAYGAVAGPEAEAAMPPQPADMRYAGAFDPSEAGYDDDDQTRAPMQAAIDSRAPAYDDDASPVPDVLHGDHEAALAADLDDALAESFEDDLPTDEHAWQSQPDSFAAGAETGASAMPAPNLNDEYAGGFDAAMAEVDMDFSDDPFAADWKRDAQQDASDDAMDAVWQAADIAESRAVVDAGSAVEPVRDAAFPGEDHQSTAPVSDPAATKIVELKSDTERDVALFSSQKEIDDAIAELSAMVRGYDRPAVVKVAAAAQPVQPAPAEDLFEIDTVDIPDEAVALADDLDIPEMSYHDDAGPLFDDLDAELAAAFGEPAIETIQPAQAAPSTVPDFDLNSGYSFGGERGDVAAMPAARAAANSSNEFQVMRGNSIADRFGQDDFDADLDDELALDEMPEPALRQPPRRGFMIAAAVGGIAVLGIVGAYALSGGSGTASGGPVLVKADTDPIKVKPKDPGGVTVPNQDSSVFDRTAAGTAPASNQPKLITSDEQPVDVASQFPDEIPDPVDESADIDAPQDPGASVTTGATSAIATPKSEDRIDEAAQPKEEPAEETIALQSRKVRTMIVKSDGSLVPREDAQPADVDSVDTVGSTTPSEAPTQAKIADPKATAMMPTAKPAPEKQATAKTLPAAKPAPKSKPEQTAAIDNDAATAKQRSAAVETPDSVPVAPSRPADQPLDIVGEVKPEKVVPAPASAAPAGSWSMQIASQPSQAAAESTYASLSKRYASVLGGRGANIVKADIAGKGTFWRVRVPAGSRNDAIGLCEDYKSAGGTCFVSK